MADWYQIDRKVLVLEKNISARDGELSDPAAAKAAADHNAFGIGPELGLEKSARHIGQFLREFLYSAVHQRRRARILAHQRLIQRTLADAFRGFAAERIRAAFPQWLAQPVQDLAERSLASTVAQKTIVILQ